MQRWHLACIVLLALLPACSAAEGRCGVCERELHPGVGAELILASGQRVSTCCLRCALHFEEGIETPARRIMVEDHTGSGLLDAAAAYVVKGSRLNPCMLPPPRDGRTRVPLKLSYDRCAPSMIAFRRERDARAFIAEHGGTLQPPGHFMDAGTPRR
jgi:hypothetical protein